MALTFVADEAHTEVTSSLEPSGQVDWLHVFFVEHRGHELNLCRVHDESGSPEGFKGPAIIAVDRRKISEGGINRVRIEPGRITVEVDAQAAAKIETEMVVVEFEVDERTLSLMRDSLRRMFADTAVYSDGLA